MCRNSFFFIYLWVSTGLAFLIMRDGISLIEVSLLFIFFLLLRYILVQIYKLFLN